MPHSKRFQAIKYTSERQIGKQILRGTHDLLYSTLYSNFNSLRHFDSCSELDQDWGGIFGFGFSPDGSILAAACENKCILLYDPGNAKLIKKKFKSHDDCVNCVSFLDNRIFATCSDDNTVRLWDSRFLRDELRILRGHTNWVKNIEYSSSAGKLITSGFDGNIFSWDINNYTDDHERLLSVKETMRLKLTRDESKLIVSTLSGYILLIHNLDLNHLKEDFQGLRRHLCHYLRTRGSSAQNYMTRMHKRNQFEFICDFPETDQAESISAMQIHPHDWCIVSRNTTSNADSEWTCVHDIQSRLTHPSRNLSSKSVSDTTPANGRIDPTSDVDFDHSVDNSASTSGDSMENAGQKESTSHCLDYSNGEGQNSAGVNEAEVSSSSSDEDVGQSSPSQRDHMSASSDTASSGDYSHRHLPSSSQTSRLFDFLPIHEAEPFFPELLLTLSERFARWEKNQRKFNQNTEGRLSQSHVQQNHFVEEEPRLLYYAEEPNVARGFIKEQSFSPDGRVIASPYGNHVRLLAFDQNCAEVCDNVPDKPRLLFEVANCALLKSSILTSIFSPTDCMFVAGARDGSIAFSQPVL